MAKEKQNGWFFSKNILEEINEIPVEDSEDNKEVNASSDNLGELELEIVRLNEQIKELTKAKDNTDLQVDEIVNEKIKKLEMEKESLNSSLEEVTAYNTKYMNKLDVLNTENKELKTKLEDVITTATNNKKNFDSTLNKMKSEINFLKESESQHDFERQVADLHRELDKKNNEIVDLQLEKEQLITSNNQISNLNSELKREVEIFNENSPFEKLNNLKEILSDLKVENMDLKSKITDLENNVTKHENEEVHSTDAVAELNIIIDKLKKENASLKEELSDSVKEIGKVMLSAQKQAKRTVEKATRKSEEIVMNAEKQVTDMLSRAKDLSLEFSESKENIFSLYNQLEREINELAIHKVDNRLENKMNALSIIPTEERL
ncbi:hypothetical protein ABG953_12585 [Enterococcus faecalis]|uniref:hypothetical protein n=1 Tax=Enterococcus faecalis TaxID=1351 RepID=UPI0019E2B515|nr:hypothetical protein [Enterococcus faecalis]EGO6705153.1 hypothetical protein [Enterococcus faecalis]